MTLTSAACPLTDVIEDQTREALTGGPGGGLVNGLPHQLGLDAAVGSGQDHRRRPRAAARARLQRLTPPVPRGRNEVMADRIGAVPVRYPFSFVVVGDTGAWPDPTADGIFGQLLTQVAALRPAPVFLANLGDFAGPGTPDRHRHYLRLVSALPFPDVCVVGNHDLDDPGGRRAWAAAHGPADYTFAYGHTRFVALDAPPRETPEGTVGPSAATLDFLDRTLTAAAEPHRVVLLHPPPRFGDRLAPHPEWGFSVGERDFLDLVRRHRVTLVCSAHALLFDQHVHEGIRFVVSGGGGTGVCSHLRGICASDDGRPEDRGALFHAVQITLGESGAVTGRVLQAFGSARITFGDPPPR